MGKAGAALAAGALLAASLAGTAAAAVAPRVIRSVDGTAACSLSTTRVVCSNTTLQKQRRPLVLVLEPGKTPRVAAGRLGWTARTPVARNVRAATAGRFTCGAVAGDLLCSDSGGGAISVGAGRFSIAAPPARHP